MRSCHPRDLIDQVTALCRYRGEEPIITRDLLDAACRAYFVNEEPTREGTRGASAGRVGARKGQDPQPARDPLTCARFHRDVFTDLVSRVLVGVLFLFLSINLLREFLSTGHSDRAARSLDERGARRGADGAANAAPRPSTGPWRRPS